MKNRTFYPFLLVLGLLFGVAATSVFAQSTTKEVPSPVVVKYTCTMHPTFVSDKPGVCPECGMKLVKIDKALMATSVKAILSNSCIACHGTGGRPMLVSMLNLSKWEELTPDEKAKKGKEINREIASNSMPPKNYINSNPGAKLSALQKELIDTWSKSLIVKK